jgi:hypothetical protein
MTIDFPKDVKTTECKTVTNSKITKTPHGIVKSTTTKEVKR